MEQQLDYINLIANLGFPITISFYLLHRLEKSFKHLEQAILNLINELK